MQDYQLVNSYSQVKFQSHRDTVRYKVIMLSMFGLKSIRVDHAFKVRVYNAVEQEYINMLFKSIDKMNGVDSDDSAI